MNFLENQARMQYRLLSHAGYYTRVRCQDVTNDKGTEEVIKGEDEFIKWCRAHHLRGNLFMGRNPYDKNGNVACVTGFSLDVDPVRPKKTASSDEQHSMALAVGRRICNVYGEGHLCSSGNGALVLFPFTPFVPDSLEQFTAQCRSFEDLVRRQFETPEVRIDATHDARRLVKVLGSVSTKGDKRHWRVARFLHSPSFQARRSKVCDAIKNTVVQLQHTNELLQIPDPEDRSAADYALALKLKEAGFGPAHIYNALCQQSYRPGREDDYRRIALKLFPQGEPDVEVGGAERTNLHVFTPSGSLEEYTNRKRGGLPSELLGLGSGFTWLDNLTQGYRPGNVYSIQAITNAGKSVFVIQTAFNLCRSNKRVLFVATEMDHKEIWDRYTAIGTGVSAAKIASGKLGEGEKKLVERFMDEFRSHSLFVRETTNPKIEEVEQLIEQIKPDVVLVDYFQHVETGVTTRAIELAKLARGYETAAKKYGVAIIVAAQLHEKYDFKTQARLPSKKDDVKDCKTINDVSSVVLVIDWCKTDDPYGDGAVPVRWEISKNRHGPRGEQIVKLVRNIPAFSE